MARFQTIISGALLTSILHESDSDDLPSFGILFGSYKMRIQQILSDTHENENIVEGSLGITHFLGTTDQFPFFHQGNIDILSSSIAYGLSESDIQSIVGLFVIRRNNLLSPSLRDVQTLIELSQVKKCRHPLILLMISVPAITNNPSWIYSMEYNCFSLPVSDFGINHSPILEQIDIHIPSLPEDISAEYRSVENSSAPTNLFNDLTFSQNLSILSQNVYCDAIVSTIRTELLVQQYLDDIKNEIVSVEELENEIQQLKLLCKS